MTGEDREDIKRHFNVVAEGLRSEIRLLAEGVGANNEKLDRFEGRLDRFEGRLDQLDFRIDRLETRIVEEFGEVKAMIRLSFGELDRRIQSLESDVHSLRARLEKLEARTQPQ